MLINFWKSIKLLRLRLKNIELNALSVFDDRYIKTKKQEHMVIKFIITFVA